MVGTTGNAIVWPCHMVLLIMLPVMLAVLCVFCRGSCIAPYKLFLCVHYLLLSSAFYCLSNVFIYHVSLFVSCVMHRMPCVCTVTGMSPRPSTARPSPSAVQPPPAAPVSPLMVAIIRTDEDELRRLLESSPDLTERAQVSRVAGCVGVWCPVTAVTDSRDRVHLER